LVAAIRGSAQWTINTPEPSSWTGKKNRIYWWRYELRGRKQQCHAKFGQKEPNPALEDSRLHLQVITGIDV